LQNWKTSIPASNPSPCIPPPSCGRTAIRRGRCSPSISTEGWTFPAGGFPSSTGSAGWIVSEFGLGRGKSVADFGCGPGLYAQRLAKAGAAVTGIDFSRRSLEYARQAAEREKLDIRYIQKNCLEFQSEERFDLILMIFLDYCALDPAQRRVLAGKFSRLLKPGGSVLLDVCSWNAFRRREEGASYRVSLRDGFWAPGKYYEFKNTFKYDAEKAAVDKYTIVEENRVRTIYNWIQYFDPQSLAAEFAESGLAVRKLLADVAGGEFDPQGDEFAAVAGRKL
jgi:SAM-dependent methyltransferase